MGFEEIKNYIPRNAMILQLIQKDKELDELGYTVMGVPIFPKDYRKLKEYEVCDMIVIDLSKHAYESVHMLVKIMSYESKTVILRIKRFHWFASQQFNALGDRLSTLSKLLGDRFYTFMHPSSEDVYIFQQSKSPFS